jgi:hypothetical protein
VNNLQNRARELREILSPIQRECPEDSQTWDAIELLLFGPELVQVRPGVNIISLESDSAMSATDTLLAQMKPYDQDIGSQDKLAGETLKQRFTQGLPPLNDEAITALMAGDTMDFRGELSDYLQLYTAFLNSTHQRDVAIAQNIMTQPGNIVLVIGYVHITDLYREVDRACHAGTLTVN